MGDRPLPPLVAWGLATFHVTTLVVALVGVLHYGGALGDLLGGLDTAIGLGVFGLLWALAWWTNRRALAGAWRGDGFDSRTAAIRAVVGGGVTGAAFFVFLFAVLSVSLVARGASALAVLAIGLLGTLLATVVGALVGAALGSVDLLLFRAVSALTAASDSSAGDDSTA